MRGEGNVCAEMHSLCESFCSISVPGSLTQGQGAAGHSAPALKCPRLNAPNTVLGGGGGSISALALTRVGGVEGRDVVSLTKGKAGTLS